MYNNRKSQEYKSLAAKSDSDDNELWLPLWMHLNDTAGVMRKLVHQWVAPSVITATSLTYEEFEKTAAFVAAVHDIGKATSYFQSMITRHLYEKRDELLNYDFVILQNYQNAGDTPHSYAGQWILESDVSGINVKKSIADVVGAHHGKPIDNTSGLYERDFLKLYPVNIFGTENHKTWTIWFRVWNEIVDDALDLCGLQSLDDLPDLTIEAQVILSGLLIVADWIASNTTYFPLISIDDTGREEVYPERVNNGFRQLSLPGGWRSGIVQIDDDLFQKRFGFPQNSVQKTMIQTVENCHRPGIFILEAQMGVGKTEASLAASEILASQCESGGIFFGLPTQATSNGLFGRLYKWGESVSTDTVSAIKLAHGAAELNEEYENIKEKVLVDNIDGEESGLEVHPWFEGNKKALLADFVIGTVDQFLMASLKRKHFMLRHLGLAGKVVIIDECHAYDTYMCEYLDRSLEWMAAYGVPVILLSATLPAKRREELVECYVRSYSKNRLGKKKPEIIVQNENWSKSDAYPLLTWTDGETICQQKIEQHVNEKQVVLETENSQEDLIAKLDKSLQDGGCACIILNTVRCAQEIYSKVKIQMKDAHVLLYHAQYTMPDRAKKEQELLKHMGKKSSEDDRNRFVLIGTQVLEQSLDYDADIMVSQLCPMDLLLQRMGRLHRHDRKRPELLKQPHFIILMDEENSYDKGTKEIYGDFLLMKTWQILKDKNYLTLPQDIPRLVQKVYSEENIRQNDKDLEDARIEYENKQRNKKEEAKNYRLDKPSRRKKIEGILLDSDQTKEKAIESAAASRVRDGASAIEVLLMKKNEDGKITAVGEDQEKRRFDRLIPPDISEGKWIARQRLRLPHIFSQEWMLEDTIRELEDRNIKELAAWQQSPWIKGEMILLLNENNQTELCGYQLTYTQEEGLMYEKILEEENE